MLIYIPPYASSSSYILSGLNADSSFFFPITTSDGAAVAGTVAGAGVGKTFSSLLTPTSFLNALCPTGDVPNDRVIAGFGGTGNKGLGGTLAPPAPPAKLNDMLEGDACAETGNVCSNADLSKVEFIGETLVLSECPRVPINEDPIGDLSLPAKVETTGLEETEPVEEK